MNRGLFDTLKRLDQYDSVASRSKVRNPAPRDGGRPDPQPINQPLGYEPWLGTQGPGAGNISPNTPQGGDYWQEEYNDYVAGWNSKFGNQGPQSLPNRPGAGTSMPGGFLSGFWGGQEPMGGYDWGRANFPHHQQMGGSLEGNWGPGSSEGLAEMYHYYWEDWMNKHNWGDYGLPQNLDNLGKGRR